MENGSGEPEHNASIVPIQGERRYYAIAKGRQIGIFKAAPSGEYNRHIRKLTNGYSDNIHRGFSTLQDALMFMKNYNFATVTVFDHLMNKLEVYALQVSLEPVLFRKGEDSVMNKEDECCKICGNTVGDDDYHPQCEVCDKWLHLPCTGLTRAELPMNEYVCMKCFDEINLNDDQHEANTIKLVTNFEQTDDDTADEAVLSPDEEVEAMIDDQACLNEDHNEVFLNEDQVSHQSQSVKTVNTTHDHDTEDAVVLSQDEVEVIIDNRVFLDKDQVLHEDESITQVQENQRTSVFNSRRRSLTIVEDFGREIDKLKNQSNFYIHEIRRLTLENRAKDLAMTTLVEEKEQIQKQLEKFTSKEAEYERTKEENSRLTKELDTMMTVITRYTTGPAKTPVLTQSEEVMTHLRKLEE